MRLEKEQWSGHGREKMDQMRRRKNKHRELIEGKVHERGGGVRCSQDVESRCSEG